VCERDVLQKTKDQPVVKTPQLFFCTFFFEKVLQKTKDQPVVKTPQVSYVAASAEEEQNQ
jgi:hypothetical protein